MKTDANIYTLIGMAMALPKKVSIFNIFCVNWVYFMVILNESNQKFDRILRDMSIRLHANREMQQICDK